ncbi:hypothetical protein VaNZ11_005510 [Volvox africanus]|uniref:Uncharacterized protein n=1 Tax=Volvox africanus TaxID=51714 RepID=A0ABQ5S0H5_9CHLO|nr:hypothetical protein VaNZ11_005510 [Volvox africanus]
MNVQHMSLRPAGPNSGLRPQALMAETSQAGTGASLRQRLLPAGVSNGCVNLAPTGNAGAVLEHLKRLSDRMTEENESTRQDVTTYREKLTEAQATLLRTEQELARERQENVVLRAKAKDDEAQVAYVLEKMKVVTAIQDSIRNSIETTKYDIGRVDQNRRDLDVKLLGQDRDVGDMQMALHAVAAARDQLAAELRRAQSLTSDLKSQLQEAVEETARKDAALLQLAVDAAAKERAAEAHTSSLQASLSAVTADLAASRGYAEQLRLDLERDRSRSAKAAAQLTERYHESQQRIMELDRQLCTAHDDQKVARDQILKLETQTQALTTGIASAHEELARMQAVLADRTSELKNTEAEAEQLGRRLEVLQAELEGREAEVQRLVEEAAEATMGTKDLTVEVQRLVEEAAEAAKRAKDLAKQEADVREELSTRAAEVARLEEELKAERELAKLKQDELSTTLAIAQANAAADTARAATVIAAAEQRVREAERAGEARLERFKERTSRENDEMRRRVRAEAEADAKRLTEELNTTTAALKAAELLAVQNAAAGEAAMRVELQTLQSSMSSEIEMLKEQLAEAGRIFRAHAQDAKAQYESELAAVRTAAQEEMAAVQLQLETEHQKERDEWDKEMEAMTAAERADAEERVRQAVEALHAELGARLDASLHDAKAAGDKGRRELEEELKKLTTRVQELESGSASGDEALASACARAAQLEQQLTAMRRDVETARMEGEGELNCLREKLENQRIAFQEHERELETQRCQLTLDFIKSCKDLSAKEEQLKHEVDKLGNEAREAQQELDQEREKHQQREQEWLKLQEQRDLERRKWHDDAEEQRRELERQLHAVEEEREQLRIVQRSLRLQMEQVPEAMDEVKKGNTSTAAKASSRKHSVQEIEVNNPTDPPARGNKTTGKEKDAMPPPPPPAVIKATKAAAPPPRVSAAKGATTATGSMRATGELNEGRASALRRAHDEFSHFTTESEMHDPSLSQDVTVKGHVAKRMKSGCAEAAPSQMPTGTKGGRFSLFKGMSMGMSMQTMTTDAAGGNEVTSAFGGGTRKRDSSNSASQRRKAAGDRSDRMGPMDLFESTSPNLKSKGKDP